MPLAGVLRVEDQPRTTLWRKIKEQEFMKNSSQYHCFTCHTKIPFSFLPTCEIMAKLPSSLPTVISKSTLNATVLALAVRR
jgi:hypothetical protein